MKNQTVSTRVEEAERAAAGLIVHYEKITISELIRTLIRERAQAMGLWDKALALAEGGSDE